MHVALCVTVVMDAQLSTVSHPRGGPAPLGSTVPGPSGTDSKMTLLMLGAGFSLPAGSNHPQLPSMGRDIKVHTLVTHAYVHSRALSERVIVGTRCYTRVHEH